MSYDFSKFDVGQGIIITSNDNDDYFHRSYRLIVDVNDNGINTIPVYRLNDRSMMYDISDSEKCKHNVPLFDSPPPFTYSDKSDVYTVANLSNKQFIAFSDFSKYDVQTSDDYAKISERDLNLVFHHDKVQCEKELTRNIANRETIEIDYSGYSNDDDLGFLFT